MTYFDVHFVANSEKSTHYANLLLRRGIRIQQRVDRETECLPVHVIAAHPDDANRAFRIVEEEARREHEALLRSLRYVRQTFTSEDVLIALQPNEAGLYASHVYRDEAFNSSRFRVVKGRWDHEHCSLCRVTINSGDEWYAPKPPDDVNEVGSCLPCYPALMDENSTGP